VDQDLATAIESLINESICDPEVLLRILLRLIVQLQVEVLEVAITLRIRFASDIQNVRHACLDQLTRLEGTLEGPHVDALVHLEQTDVSNCLLTINIASAEVYMRESATDDLLFLPSVRLTVIVHACAGFLFVDGGATDARISIYLLELGD